MLDRSMKTLTLNTNGLFNNFFDEWDRAFFNEDHSYWRRQNNSALKHHNEGDYREVYVPLPGFKKENVKGEVNDGVVSITARQDDNTAAYSFVFPEDVDLSTISTSLEDGLLTVRAEKEPKAKSIEIKID